MRCGVDGRCLTEAQPSGISWYAFHMLWAMAKQAPQDQFIIFVSGHHPQRNLVDQLSVLPNVQLRFVGWPNKLLHGAAAIRLMPPLEHWLGPIDVLFAPNLHFLPHYPTTPLVITVHDLSYQLFPQFLSFKRWWWHRMIHPANTLQRAKQLICVSAVTQRDVTQHYQIPLERTTVIHSGIPTPASAEPVVDLPQHYAVVLSTLEPRKNVAAVFSAFQQYWSHYPQSQLNLVVVGAAGWKSSKVTNTLQTNSRIHYYGYVTPGQKTTILQSARMLVYPSIYEGFGFPPLEALQCGVPVITSYTGALPEILGSAALYVDPYIQSDLVHAIHQIDTNQAVRTRLQQAATAIVARYQWDSAAQATLNVLREAIY